MHMSLSLHAVISQCVVCARLRRLTSNCTCNHRAERLAKSLGVELQQAVGAVPQGAWLGDAHSHAVNLLGDSSCINSIHVGLELFMLHPVCLFVSTHRPALSCLQASSGQHRTRRRAHRRRSGRRWELLLHAPLSHAYATQQNAVDPRDPECTCG